MKKFKLFFRNWIGGQKDTLAPVSGSEPEHVRAMGQQSWPSFEKPKRLCGSDTHIVLLSSETIESDIEWYRRRS